MPGECEGIFWQISHRRWKGSIWEYRGQDSIDDIVSVSSELVGNSYEHAKADVLIDIDVSGKYSVNEEKQAFVEKL